MNICDDDHLSRIQVIDVKGSVVSNLNVRLNELRSDSIHILYIEVNMVLEPIPIIVC